MTTKLMKFETPELASIEKSKALQIKETFEPMAKMLAEFEDAYNMVIAESEKEITKEVTANAKRLRIDIGKVRIETEKLRKDQKEEYLRAGKAIDGVSNILKWAVSDKENKLKEIESYFEIQEQKRIDALQAKRAEKLSLYVEDAHQRDLVKFEDDEFEALLSMKKKEQEDRIAAEKKAEEERVAREKAETEERERIRKENEQLRKEAEEREELAKIEADKRAKIEDERIKKEQAERKAREEREAAELKARKEAEAKKEAEHQAQLKKEREARENAEREERAKREALEAELKAKKEAEEKAKKEAEEQKEADLRKGDADKLKDLLTDLEYLKTKYVFKSEKNKKMYADVVVLIEKVVNHIKK